MLLRLVRLFMKLYVMYGLLVGVSVNITIRPLDY